MFSIKAISCCLLFFGYAVSSFAQQDSVKSNTHSGLAQDDPSQFLTRVEVFNELQYRESLGHLNVTMFRSVIALGKKMTTRFDIPVVHNTAPIEGYDRSGIGDISIRLLGYRIVESKRMVALASAEFSFNTAQSPLLGTGKNIISPVLAASWRIPKHKTVIAGLVQEYFSLWGDNSRPDISWTKLQFFLLNAWSRRAWTMLAPEMYFNHHKSGASLNLEATAYYRVTGRCTLWLKSGAGLFGNHPARYQWTMETGLRYLMLRKGSIHLRL
jgi:hypothetical protein